MSGDRREPYAGRGIPKLAIPRQAPAPVQIEPASDATYLPDPEAKLALVRRLFGEARGWRDIDRTAYPRMQASDVRQAANHFTLALRNDLPSLDRRDAAAIWDEWRTAIARLREDLRVEGGTPPAQSVFELLARSVASLRLALQDPGAAFLSYCPWRHDWATFDRLYPERVEHV